MSITRVGSTKKFAEGWDGIFKGKRGNASAKKSPSKKTAAKKKSPKKAAKNAAPAPVARYTKKRAKPAKSVANGKGPGDAETKKSAAKRKSKTRTKRPKPVLHQMELF
jgi:hypothetical protein